MSILQNKIDFIALAAVTDANPNGNPLDGNRPRTTYDGRGEISDVCIKRKLRNRLQDNGEKIFVQSEERCDDGEKSLSDRVKTNLPTGLSSEEFAKQACELWYDVRSFGQVFAFKGAAPKEGVSVGVRGPVSIHQAKSMSSVEVISQQITKSVNSEPGNKKGSDTMGMKHRIGFGLYEIKGSINVQLAEKTGFTEDDAEALKEALRTLFVNDASSARPDGSMEIVKVYWWRHNNKIGQYSSAKVHDSLQIQQKEPEKLATCLDDYEIRLMPLENLEPEIIEGM